jgi:hypothetical protein
MSTKRLLSFAALALLAFAHAAQAQNQNQDQNQDQKVIDDFVGTRGVSFDDPAHKPAPPRQPARTNNSRRNNSAASTKNSGAAGGLASHKPSASNAPKTGGASTGNGNKVSAQSDGEATTGAGAKTLNASATGGGALQPVGLGYTVFMKDKAGGLVPVDAAQEFHSGDRIAVSLEPNTEGYIYVFEAENDRDPIMLFPNVVLDGGANAAHPHTRETYPSDVSYAFEFDQNPAVEHLYVVVSRHPLAGVPAGEALAAFCGKKRDDCYWKPTPEQWQSIKAGATDRHITEAKNVQLAQGQKQPVPAAGLQRGIKIKREDPAPAVVRVNDSPDADALVTVIKLVHK